MRITFHVDGGFAVFPGLSRPVSFELDELPEDQAGADISQMLASIEQNRMNMLKPTPAQAKLAYLMLSLPQVN